MSWPGTRSQKNVCLVNSKIHHQRNLTVTSSKCMNRTVHHRQEMIYLNQPNHEFHANQDCWSLLLMFLWHQWCNSVRWERTGKFFKGANHSEDTQAGHGWFYCSTLPTALQPKKGSLCVPNLLQWQIKILCPSPLWEIQSLPSLSPNFSSNVDFQIEYPSFSHKNWTWEFIINPVLF